MPRRPYLPSPAHAPPSSRLSAWSVVVEDNRVNRLIAERFCRALGIAVDMAEDGRAGFEAVASAQPPYDLVFMDCQMPVWDGVSWWEKACANARSDTP